MLVGRCLNSHQTALPTRSNSFHQRCCSFLSCTSHQQPQHAQAAARTTSECEVLQPRVVAPVADRLPGCVQFLDEPCKVVTREAQLNEGLKRSLSWEELSHLLITHRDVVDFVNVSTAWTRLASLYNSSSKDAACRQRAREGPPVGDPAFRLFVARLIELTNQHLRLFRARALANVIWAMSSADWKLEQHEPVVGALVDEWCALVLGKLPELGPMDVSNISAAVGRLDGWWRPEFLADFYRSVLQREDLLDQLDVSAMNNVLFGLSRVRRRGLATLGPYTYRRLYQAVCRLLERESSRSNSSSSSSSSTGGKQGAAATASWDWARRLSPWRAAQLMYNCHQLGLRLWPRQYRILIPLVTQLYTRGHGDGPSPLDRWSFSFLTAFVEAHGKVMRRERPDMQPLYAYVEGRLHEATCSDLTVLAHVFAEMGCPLQRPFWAHLFSRYTSLEARQRELHQQAHRGAAGAAAEPESDTDGTGDLGQGHGQGLGTESWWGSESESGSVSGSESGLESGFGLGLRQETSSRWPAPAPRRSGPQPEAGLGWSGGVGALRRGQEQQPQEEQPQQPQQWGLRSPCGQSAQSGHHQHHHRPDVQRSASPQLGRAASGPQSLRRPSLPPAISSGREVPRGNGYNPLPGQQQHPQRPEASRHPQGFPRPSSQQHQEQQQHYSAGPRQPQGGGTSVSRSGAVADQPEPSQGKPLAAWQPPPPRTRSRAASEQPPGEPHQRQRFDPEGQRSQQPWLRQQHGDKQPAAGAPQLQAQLQQEQKQERDEAQQSHPEPLPPAAAPDPATLPGTPSRSRTGPRSDDLLEPRTLHYVCWQAARARIIPPKCVLRLYLSRVPRWLVHEASDKEVAQAVWTLEELRWTPPQAFREALEGALRRRAARSHLIRKMLRMLRKVR